jgi:hypothetical protein
MPSLVSESDIQFITGSLVDLFETFTGQLIVNKEPKKTLVAGTTDTRSLPGYPTRRDNQSFTYVPQSGIFPALGDSSSDGFEVEPDVHFRYPKGILTIKVRDEAKDYIFNGVKTENVIFKGQTYNIDGDAEPRSCFGYDLWNIKVKKTS